MWFVTFRKCFPRPRPPHPPKYLMSDMFTSLRICNTDYVPQNTGLNCIKFIFYGDYFQLNSKRTLQHAWTAFSTYCHSMTRYEFIRYPRDMPLLSYSNPRKYNTTEFALDSVSIYLLDKAFHGSLSTRCT